MVKEGDICILDESVEYSILGEKPFGVLVLWNGVNGQPLVTRTNEYRPFWTTYSQLVKVVRHIDLVEALSSIQPEQKEITTEDVKTYCESRNLVVLTKELFDKMNNVADEVYLYLKDKEGKE